MKTLLFGYLEQAAATLEGRKEVTIRKYREEAHSFSRGEIVLGVFGPEDNPVAMLLRIMADTQTGPFKGLPDDAAIADGFRDGPDAFEGLKDYYPDLQPDDLAAVIWYEPVRTADGKVALVVSLEVEEALDIIEGDPS